MTISAKEYLEFDSPPQLVDVREHYEWDSGHIKGALHIPLGQVTDRSSEILPHAVVYCRSGKRSQTAVDELTLLGVTTLSLDGGIIAWKEAGYSVEKPEGLNSSEYDRYSRHLLLPELGMGGQLKLKQTRVLVVGAGGLGSPVIQYLAAAGVGTLGIVDDDDVELSNLQRQTIHTTRRVGSSKADSAHKFVHELNSEVKVIQYLTRLDRDNAQEIIENYDIIVDGTDNFPTRYLLSDLSVRLHKPIVSASILSFEGQLTVFKPDEGPCYRCIYPDPPPAEMAPNCSDNGVLGAMAGVVGTMQAVEAVKLIVGAGRPLVGRLLLYDALEPSFMTLKTTKRPDCLGCGPEADLTGPLPDYIDFCTV